jgi:hypothetical protein
MNDPRDQDKNPDKADHQKNDNSETQWEKVRRLNPFSDIWKKK